MKAKSLKKLLMIQKYVLGSLPGLDGWKVCSQENDATGKKYTHYDYLGTFTSDF